MSSHFDAHSSQPRYPSFVTLNLRVTSAVAIVLLAACSDAPRELTTADRLKGVKVVQETRPDFYLPRKSVDYLSELKNSKDALEIRNTKLVASPAASVVRADAARGQVAATRDAISPSATLNAPIVTPGSVPSPAPAPAPLPPAATQAVSSTPSSSVAMYTATSAGIPRYGVSDSAPVRAQESISPRSTATDTVGGVANIIRSSQPKFPNEASVLGVENGVVRARMTINASGDVSNVAILASTPPRVFDREVRATLSRWKFDSGVDGRIADQEIKFQR